jgi:hypothetical protein
MPILEDSEGVHDMNDLAVRRPRTASVRLAAAAGFACLVLATGCSSGSATPAGPAGSAPTPGPAPAAAAPVAPTDYCSGLAAVSAKTRELGSQSSISPAQYTATADAMAALVPLAPADAATPLKTLVDEYHKIGAGSSTIESSGSKVGAATLKLAESTQKHCMGG